MHTVLKGFSTGDRFEFGSVDLLPPIFSGTLISVTNSNHSATELVFDYLFYIYSTIIGTIIMQEE